MPRYTVTGYYDTRQPYVGIVEAVDEDEAEEKARCHDFESVEDLEPDIVEELVESMEEVK